MQVRNDLFIQEEDRNQLQGDGPVALVMPRGLKCAAPQEYTDIEYPEPGYGVSRSRELADGRVVCMNCQHGPCQLPGGIGWDRELHIYKEENLNG